MDSDFGEARDVFRIFSPGTKTAGSEETVAGRGRRVRDEIEGLERRCSRSPPWEEHWADLAVDEVEDPRLKREAIIKVLEVSCVTCHTPHDFVFWRIRGGDLRSHGD